MLGKTRVGVLRGGVSGEYDVSLESGKAVLEHLSQEKYEPVDILIDQYGEWHIHGVALRPERIFPHVDVVWNALHGYYGEDGKVQKLLERFRVPYTGSRALGSALGMNKALAKEIFKQHGWRTPFSRVVRKKELTHANVAEIYRTFPQPSIVKPVASGSSLGVTRVYSFEDFLRGLQDAFAHGRAALIEQLIPGREATCGIIDSFRGERLYALPPVEIIPPDGRFFDYEMKYNGQTREVCPSTFAKKEKEELMRLAREAHTALGLRHYSRTDFIVSPRGVYVLEANTLPGLTEESLLPKARAAVGCTLPEFLDHVIGLALAR